MNKNRENLRCPQLTSSTFSSFWGLNSGHLLKNSLFDHTVWCRITKINAVISTLNQLSTFIFKAKRFDIFSERYLLQGVWTKTARNGSRIERSMFSFELQLKMEHNAANQNIVRVEMEQILFEYPLGLVFICYSPDRVWLLTKSRKQRPSILTQNSHNSCFDWRFLNSSQD